MRHKLRTESLWSKPITSLSVYIMVIEDSQEADERQETMSFHNTLKCPNMCCKHHHTWSHQPTLLNASCCALCLLNADFPALSQVVVWQVMLILCRQCLSMYEQTTPWHILHTLAGLLQGSCIHQRTLIVMLMSAQRRLILQKCCDANITAKRKETCCQRLLPATPT